MIARLLALPALLAAPLAAPLPAAARTICTFVADAAGGKPLVEAGDCRTRVTPASTFKIPLALMGFESGILADAGSPRLPFREGYPAWGGAEWRRETDPVRWMRHSVVWYSQEVARRLGPERFARYAASFDYGNADVSGDPGRGNGLERAWLTSSLAVSPAEQAAFLSRLVAGRLPVAPRAAAAVEGLLEPTTAGGWEVRGKTGTAPPRGADGRLDHARSWGWFVGYARRGDRTLVFARLDQDEARQATPAGPRARDGFLRELPTLLARADGPRSGRADDAKAGDTKVDASRDDDPKGRAWTQEKCTRYRAAWTQALGRMGRTGLGPDFVAAHEAFLASGCTARADVCPRSKEELAIANVLVIAAMNAGTASSFLPFACRR